MTRDNDSSVSMLELLDRTTEEIIIPRLPNVGNINQYLEQEEFNIINSRMIDSIKATGNVRILSINPHGCLPSNTTKINMLKDAIRNYQIDMLLMNETNTKWNMINISRMERNMRGIDREAAIFVADSKEWETTPSDYLPGGVMSVIFSKYSPLVNKKKIIKGWLEN